MFHDTGSRQLSEHERRIQRSLNRLDVPEWYTNYSQKGSPNDSAKKFRSNSLAGGWSGLSGSKTTSLTSLQFSGGRTPTLSTFRTGTSSSGARLSSRDSLVFSPSSTASPSPYYERAGTFTYGMPYPRSRFTSTRLSYGVSPGSLSPSPSSSPIGHSDPGSPAPSSSYSKTAYLGWRSQERLANSGSLYRLPVSERLAADFHPPQKQVFVKPRPPPQSQSSSLSSDSSDRPVVTSSVRKPVAWIESSFVGARPSQSSFENSPRSVNRQMDPYSPVNGSLNVFRYEDNGTNGQFEEEDYDTVF